jgi:hypothetical protein
MNLILPSTTMENGRSGKHPVGYSGNFPTVTDMKSRTLNGSDLVQGRTGQLLVDIIQIKGKADPPPDWEGRYSPGFYRQHSNSSSRRQYQPARSSEPYNRLGERSGRRSDGRDDWAMGKYGRHEEYPPPHYIDKQYGYEYDVQDSRREGPNLQRNTLGAPAIAGRGGKSELSMDAPTKRPLQLDRYCFHCTCRSCMEILLWSMSKSVGVGTDNDCTVSPTTDVVVSCMKC